MIEQDEIDKKIFDEYLKFSKDFDEKVKLHSNLKFRMRKFRDFMYAEVPLYVGNKLMPIMFSNLVKTHTDMMPLDDKDNYLFVATAKGIRKKYRHSSHSNALSLNELHSLCNGKFSEVETWFKSILKPKRLLVLNQFREAFNNGFNDEWIGKNDKRVSFEVPVDRMFGLLVMIEMVMVILNC